MSGVIGDARKRVTSWCDKHQKPATQPVIPDGYLCPDCIDESTTIPENTVGYWLDKLTSISLAKGVHIAPGHEADAIRRMRLEAENGLVGGYGKTANPSRVRAIRDALDLFDSGDDAA